MGTDGYFERIASEVLDGVEPGDWNQLDIDGLRRAIILALKEVDRDTRHRAHEAIERCAHNVFDSRPV